MKAFLKYLTLFLVGGAFYYALEVLFRGYSFLAMAGCGGLCFIICGVLNEKDRCMPLVLQMAIAASGITAIEFYFRIDFECMAWAEYVGLQQYAREYSWSDMPSVHGPLVFSVSRRDNPG